jgi:hypothetical protein
VKNRFYAQLTKTSGFVVLLERWLWQTRGVLMPSLPFDAKAGRK